jgi:hypothetical protein
MKRLSSRDLPQADKLESVLLAVLAVKNGAITDIDIADNIPGIKGDARQGRYYRNAAQMLGFITNKQNHAELTWSGDELLRNPILKNPVFISAVLSLEIYQKLIPYLELHTDGLSRDEILSFLESISNPDIGKSMINRRISTILAWPKTLGFLHQAPNGKYKFHNNLTDDYPVFEITRDDQPLLPVEGSLTEYLEHENEIAKAQSTLSYFRDQAKLERANRQHKTLIDLVARRIRNSGGLPKSNQIIDLAVKLDHNYIFEMKSTNLDNQKAQIRKGISQLFEYRYVQHLTDARLVLVIEKPLAAANGWMLDYLENDRGINLIWDGNNELYGSEKTKNQLGFLQLS